MSSLYRIRLLVHRFSFLFSTATCEIASTLLGGRVFSRLSHLGLLVTALSTPDSGLLICLPTLYTPLLIAETTPLYIGPEADEVSRWEEKRHPSV